jgi:hypothetical protein
MDVHPLGESDLGAALIDAASELGRASRALRRVRHAATLSVVVDMGASSIAHRAVTGVLARRTALAAAAAERAVGEAEGLISSAQAELSVRGAPAPVAPLAASIIAAPPGLKRAIAGLWHWRSRLLWSATLLWVDGSALMQLPGT